MILGITGGIGSGKSLVTDYLKNEYGFITIKTDDLARELMNTDEVLKDRLKTAFGPEIFDEDDRLAKKVYASVIHSSKKNRMLSDDIVHPYVWCKVSEIVSPSAERGDNYAVESALPGIMLGKICNEIWHVHAGKEIRVERLVRDRGYSRDYAEAVIKGQIPEEEYSSLADHVLENSTSVEELYLQVDGLMNNRIERIARK